ncbi:MAG: HEPN domain-containing protein [Deltaproteobacteria bacterium]|nr:HEPN domain-containing protein [Deltaproteobacteria bacterium]
MADPKIVGEWLQKAGEDLNFARSTLQESSNYFAQICFHFHQAAEKFLKAYIVAYDLEFEKTYNLMRLLSICSSENPDMLSLNEECARLNTAYIDTRYPVHWPVNYTMEKAQNMKKDAEAIESAVVNFLSENGYR